jgi:hypothetical protein
MNRISKIDREAYKLAIERLLRDEPERRQQIDLKRKEDGFEETGRFAAYCCQCNALKLKLLEDPPCHVYEEERDDPRNQFTGYEQAIKILREMLDLGISRWHPDPLAAIEEAKKKAAA